MRLFFKVFVVSDLRLSVVPMADDYPVTFLHLDLM